MKIKLTTENITGLSKQVLSLLANYGIDIKRTEVKTGLMYVQTEEVEKNIEREVASKLIQIKGINWVEGIKLMPAIERNLFLNTILNAVSDPVFGINNKGRIIYQNAQAQECFHLKNKTIKVIGDVFEDNKWAKKIDSAASNALPINIRTISGSMLVEVRGINQKNQKPIGAVLIFHKPENIATQSHLIQAADIQCFDNLIIGDKAIQDTVNRAKHMSKTLAPLVIYGESGVGKKTFAQAMHIFGRGNNQLFSSINCSLVRPSQLSKDLFGFANPTSGRAGLLEICNGGTLYIESIDDMPEDCQQTLLTYLQTGAFIRVGGKIKRNSKVKIITSCLSSLQNYVDAQQFNHELFYALDISQLSLPALRERTSDIEPLITYFLNLFNSQGGMDLGELTFVALTKIKSYFWPGNITQLKDVLYKATLLAEEGIIEAEHIEIDGHVHIEGGLEGRSLPQAVAEFEKHFLQHWYQKYSSTRKLANKLGVSHTTIAQKLNKYGVRYQNS